MTKLENFVGMMTGHFDNKDQFDKVILSLIFPLMLTSSFFLLNWCRVSGL